MSAGDAKTCATRSGVRLTRLKEGLPAAAAAADGAGTGAGAGAGGAGTRAFAPVTTTSARRHTSRPGRSSARPSASTTRTSNRHSAVGGRRTVCAAPGRTVSAPSRLCSQRCSEAAEALTSTMATGLRFTTRRLASKGCARLAAGMASRRARGLVRMPGFLPHRADLRLSLLAMGFASTNDLADKTVSFDELGPGLYAYTAQGDPNSGVIVGPDGVVVVDAQATPTMARDVQARIVAVTDKKVTQVVLTHYHAVRVLGASG